MQYLKVGQHAVHPVHGACTITYIGDSYVGIRLDAGQDVLVRSESFDAVPDAKKCLDTESKDISLGETWPDNTFVLEGEVAYEMGPHWSPFYDDFRELWDMLPHVIQHCDPLVGYGMFYKDRARPVPADWPTATCFSWPDAHQGLIFSVADQSRELVEIYPFWENGVQASIVLDRVDVLSSGVSAHICGGWEDAGITFFDTHYLINRGFYEAGNAYEFILSGIAYSAAPSTVMELPFIPNSEQLAWQQVLAGQVGATEQAPLDVLKLQGVAILLPVSEWGKDDYEFRGKVKAVKGVPDMLGQKSWLVHVVVMRFDEQEVVLPTLITQRAWKGTVAPEVGQDIEGLLWLQGRLWSV